MTAKKETLPIHITKPELLSALDLSLGRLKKKQRKGCPGAEGRGRNSTWNLLDVAQWIVQQPVHPQEKPETRKRAADIIRQHERPEMGTSPTGDPPAETPCDVLGLEGAVERLRQAENATYQRWMQAIERKEPDQGLEFQSWQKSLDLLRKAEGNLLELLERRRELLPADEVRLWLSRRVEAAKSTLLDMPGKLAPSLENLPWSEIQKTLESEVRHALSRLADTIE